MPKVYIGIDDLEIAKEIDGVLKKVTIETDKDTYEFIVKPKINFTEEELEDIHSKISDIFK